MTVLPVAGRVEVRRAYRRLLRAEKLAVAVILLLNVLATVAGLAAPALLGRIVDGIARGGAPIDRLALMMVAATAAETVLTRYGLRAGFRFGERTAARIREEFVDRLLDLPAAVAERVPAGDLAARGAGDVGAVATSVSNAVPQVFIASLRVVFLLGAVVVVAPLAGGAGLIALAGVAVALRWYLHRARTAYLTEGEANSRIADELGATVEGARTVEAFRLASRRIASGDEAVAPRGPLTSIATWAPCRWTARRPNRWPWPA